MTRVRLHFLDRSSERKSRKMRIRSFKITAMCGRLRNASLGHEVQVKKRLIQSSDSSLNPSDLLGVTFRGLEQAHAAQSLPAAQTVSGLHFNQKVNAGGKCCSAL